MTYFGISDYEGTLVEAESTRIPWRWRVKVRYAADDGVVTTFDHFWGTSDSATEVVADQWNAISTGWPYEDWEDE